MAEIGFGFSRHPQENHSAPPDVTTYTSEHSIQMERPQGSTGSRTAPKYGDAELMETRDGTSQSRDAYFCGKRFVLMSRSVPVTGFQTFLRFPENIEAEAVDSPAAVHKQKEHPLMRPRGWPKLFPGCPAYRVCADCTAVVVMAYLPLHIQVKNCRYRPTDDSNQPPGRGVLSMHGLTYGVIRLDSEEKLSVLTMQDVGLVMPGAENP
ncbi:PREDICTED: uncharacterized protein LOC105575608 [Cercocebus atys]|uniref:uncharacterized protein LOC105575608 n=1 Tax=Cercocebus atys TaxID=9531 RepID=UPI0005F4DEED|nr:PREDICTED: uncharacterized protein LOC105575608 [Cercocebus atys]